jgi:hypothetical protein
MNKKGIYYILSKFLEFELKYFLTLLLGIGQLLQLSQLFELDLKRFQKSLIITI